jgi:hypothetical protein
MGVGTFVSTPNHTLTNKGFTERWNGRSWAIVASANAAGVDDTEVASVSCPTVVNCVAVGAAFSAQFVGDTFAEVFR